MNVISCVATEHNPWLVLLAGLVCIAGSWVCFDLLQRARERGGVQRRGWVFLSAVAFGCAAWSTHFIAMLAYETSAPIHYDPLITLASLVIAVAGAGGAIHLMLRGTPLAPLLGGAVLGLVVALMHYTGMWALNISGFIDWDLYYVGLSLVFSVTLAALAINFYFSGVASHHRYGALAALVASVLLLHFTGMTAITILPLSPAPETLASPAGDAMAIAIAAVVLLIIATGVISQTIDTRANSEALQRLHKLAHYDQLTGLPNRTQFLETLHALMQSVEGTGKSVALVSFDLDNFKTINDLRGHDVGDKALKSIAEDLENETGHDEIVSRIGGDEFVAAKVFGDPIELQGFLKRIETVLFRPIRLDDLEWISGASIGVALYRKDAVDPERLLICADLAMYRAKADPARSVCYYEPDMDRTQRERRILAQDLRQSIERDELEVYYQAQVAVRSDRISAYEALLRWNHPTRGRVPPSEFIPLAEETGSIVALGEWALRTACTEAARWPRPHKVAVNISSIQLSRTDLCHRVAGILQETGLPPERLELEITESAFIANRKGTLLQLAQLRALGVTIAIDDFGTGYSSLEMLRSFPFDKIKLDRSFMWEIEHSNQAIAFLRAVIALGRSLGIPILAEGVESTRQFEILKREGCDEAQGYLLGRPSPEVEGSSQQASSPSAAA